MKMKSKLIQMISIWDILLTWLITRALDYLMRRFGRRISFEGNTHISDYVAHSLLSFSRESIEPYLSLIIRNKKRAEKIPIMQLFFVVLVNGLLFNHRDMHRYGILKEETCSTCQIITRHKDFLLNFASSQKLYPPFKFSRR